MKETENVYINVDEMIGKLTSHIGRVSNSLEDLHEISKTIALGERYAENFVMALTKLFVQINRLEKEDE